MTLKTIEMTLFEYACQELGMHSPNNHLIAFVDARSQRRRKVCSECGASLPYRGFYVRRNVYTPVSLTTECRVCVSEKALMNHETRKANTRSRGSDAGMLWSLEDDAFICKNYFYATDKELARRLGRTEGEIKARRVYSLNLKRSATLNESLKQRRLALSISRQLHEQADDDKPKRARRRR